MDYPFTWTITAPDWVDLQAASRICAHALKSLGYHVQAFVAESPRCPGDRTLRLTASARPVYGLYQTISLLVVLDESSLPELSQSFSSQLAIIYDQEQLESHRLPPSAFSFGLPLTRLAREVGEEPATISSVILGAVMALNGFPLALLEPLLETVYVPQGAATVSHHRAAAQAGYALLAKKRSSWPGRLRGGKPQPATLLDGEQAIGLGAIASSMTMVAIQPGTCPSLVDMLVSDVNTQPMTVEATQPLDIASGMALGGAVAGCRAMIVHTSSQAYLTEMAYRQAHYSETPLVDIIITGRPGAPLSQDGIDAALHIGPDNPLRVVIAPSKTEECFLLIQEAANVADRYQQPVILLLDNQLLRQLSTAADLSAKITPADRGGLLTAKEAQASHYTQRYAITKTGISPRKVPGQPGTPLIANAGPHNADGWFNQDRDTLQEQADKRLHKLDSLPGHLLPFKLHGPQTAEITLVCTGSPTNAALEAAKLLENDGLTINVLQLIYLAPFPGQQIAEIFRGGGHLLLIEAASTPQIADLIHLQTNIDIKHRLLCTGRQLFPEDIVQAVKKEFTHALK